MKAEKNKVVSIHYTLTDDQGTELDKSGDTPLEYLHGHLNIIPGLENALEGKMVNDTFKVSIEAKDAYGELNPEMIKEVPRKDFPEQESLEIGMQFQMNTEEGQAVITITGLTESSVTIDGNHPLAGMNLNFDITVSDVRDATKHEIEHGHPGHCNHNH